MKKIDKFLNRTANTNDVQSMFGGKAKDTGTHDDCGNYEDTWYDNDNDSKFSPGDTICTNSNPPCNPEITQ